MRLLSGLSSSLLLAGASIASALSWTFDEATVAVAARGSGVGGSTKEIFAPNKPLAKPLNLSAGDTLRISLTTLEGTKGKRPHQAFLTLTIPGTPLEESFALSVKESGKGKVEVTQKDLPQQLLTSTTPLEASITIASFGTTTPLSSPAFTLTITPDPMLPPPPASSGTRYAAQPLLSHTFRPPPSSPPFVVTLVFFLAVAATLPALFIAWAALGANLGHVAEAAKKAPVAHAVFFGSVVAMEAVFALYFVSWSLFRMLPVAAAVGAVAFVSGGRALSEVQERRLAGLR
ncbi:hypothetical protein BDY21DRAFT_425205 [Lineolata rhizophorae]|uniref:Ribophorin II C-terminal domain-containing protein n=1 Tax=Lineolata rhizophorae TaxID=578093 RepID=A0A6A6NLH2_9PEZI|nr:hypothetical protein BDY21DRAFT_425205 [Lineolata rhizophorae]